MNDKLVKQVAVYYCDGLLMAISLTEKVKEGLK